MTTIDDQKDISKNRIKDTILYFITAFYFSLWYGSVVPAFLVSNTIDYLTIGITGSVLFLIGGLIMIVDLRFNKISSIFILLLNFVLVVFSFFYTEVWWILSLGVAQGLLLGYLLKICLPKQNLLNSGVFWILGMLMSFILYFLPFKFENRKISEGTNLSNLLDIENSAILIVILTSLLVLLVSILFKKSDNKIQLEKDKNRNNHSKFLLFGIYFTAFSLVLIEVSFFFWAIVLKDQSQGFLYQLTLPLTLLTIIVLRQFIMIVPKKLFNLGWIFAFSLVLTFSLGLFYTFDFTLLFILSFGFVTAYYLHIITSVFQFSFTNQHIGYLLIFIAISMGISGLYIQNHIEYIISIKLPENVVHLSAKQAWIKELASFSALLVIISGILFLKRRKLNLKSKTVVTLIIIGCLTSCSDQSKKPGVTNIITEYEVFTDTISKLTKGVWKVTNDSIRSAKKEKYSQLIFKLESLDSTNLSLDDFINKDLLLLEMENELNDIEFESHLLPLNAEGGFLTEIIYSIQYEATKTKSEKKNYIDKLNALPAHLSHFQNLMKIGILKDKVSPIIVTQRCLDLVAPMISIQKDDNIFVSPCNDNDSLKQVVMEIVTEKIVPAYQSFYTFLSKDYLSASKKSPSISQLPGGRKFYELKTKYFTTLSMTPEEVFLKGENEVSRIKSEMEIIIKRTGFKGSFVEFVSFLRKDPQFYAKTPRELLYRASWIGKRMEGKLPTYFNKLPRMPFTVEEVSPSIAPNYTSGRYSEGNYETGKAGAYWVNTFKLESRPLYALPALTLHEAVPGHHLQIMLSREMTGVPKFRQNLYISAFGEGWGLYSEYLGKEAGMYETDYEDFGRLTYEMWRACRLVIDPGLHYKNWSRQQAIDFMASNTALSMHEVNTEIDRYIGWPAQAVSYKIGEMKIRQLRQKAEESLKGHFDIKIFHDAILKNGSVRLSTLDKIVSNYIKEEEIKAATKKKI